MGSKEEKLSDYIDRLNAEQKPEEDEYSTDSEELKELFQTVKLVRSLKEPTMPETGYQEKLKESLANKTSAKSKRKFRKWTWLTSVASIAAVFIVMMNVLLPFGDGNIVSAMEKAFKDVKAYHGVMEIVQTNGEGESTTQSKLEVWANKDGKYVIKGLDGAQKDLITVNNGEKKWQVNPNQKEVNVKPALPDAYRFVFELGNEVNHVTNAVSTKVIGDDMVADRKATILEVEPQGGETYKIWIDKETKLPLQKQSAMHNAVQYKVTYTKLDLKEAIPNELLVYQVPDTYKEIVTNEQKIIDTIDKAQATVGFIPKTVKDLPKGFEQNKIAIIPNKKMTEIYYRTMNNDSTIILMQSKAVEEFNPNTNAILGKVNDHTAEIQSPIFDNVGILSGSGPYAGITDISSIRWQNEGYEYAVIGNTSLDVLTSFAKGLEDNVVTIPEKDTQLSSEPKVKVEYDMEVEENDQKSVDAGSSPWKLDPAYVAQVFVNLQLSPEGITGEPTIGMDHFKIVENTGTVAKVEVTGDKTPTKNVYLKRLVRQDATGIWTVVGYDPVE